jgi:hypothetical protein
MTDPPKKERGLGGTALKADSNKQAYHRAQRLQASLRRLNRTASIPEIPTVLAATLAQLTCTSGTRRKL